MSLKDRVVELQLEDIYIVEMKENLLKHIDMTIQDTENFDGSQDAARRVLCEVADTWEPEDEEEWAEQYMADMNSYMEEQKYEEMRDREMGLC